ncbi:hypothetical protein [Roseovarius sp. 2305UL8-3]|uniref:hypothetical protein n=1 Tax=Roseovarius conchicola TaxID=3121636 RepID=UPI0035281019
MSFTKSIAAGIAIAVIGTGAIAGEAKIYTYASKENFCPAGLQPITISGVICCGTPNTSHTYQKVMAHPVKKKTHHVRQSRAVDTCREGEKGCY